MRDFLRDHQIPIASILFLALSLYTLTAGIRGAGEAVIVKRFIHAVVAPVQYYLVSGGERVGEIWKGYIELVDVREENQRLKAEIRRLLLENERLREEAMAVARLKRYLEFKRTSPFALTAVRVIGRDPSLWSASVLVDKGKEDGIVKGLPAITPEGVVGRVIEAYKGSSRVLLITDPSSAVDGMIQRSRVRGIVKGKGRDRLELVYVAKEADVKVGDVVITSGLSGIFPKGLPIGVVTEVSQGRDTFFKHVEVKPKVEMERVEELLIVR